MFTANLIKIIHLLFVLFIVLTPFFGTEMLLTYHFIAVPFLVLHWITNNDTCALTLLESKVRGVDDNQTFMGNIIKPIYNAHLTSKHYYWILGLLFLITVIRLHYTYKFWYVNTTFKLIQEIFKPYVKRVIGTLWTK